MRCMLYPGGKKKTRLLRCEDSSEREIPWKQIRNTAILQHESENIYANPETAVEVKFDDDGNITSLALLDDAGHLELLNKLEEMKEGEEQREVDTGAVEPNWNATGVVAEATPYRKGPEPYGHLRFESVNTVEWSVVPLRTKHHPDRLSGWIELALKVTTPLALYGTSKKTEATRRYRDGGWREETAEDRHIEVSLPKVRVIPGSSIKGVARAWYEAITGSARLIAPEAISWRRQGITGRDELLAGLLLRVGADLQIVPCDPVKIATPPPPSGSDDYELPDSADQMKALLKGEGFGGNKSEIVLKNGAQSNSGWLVVSASAGSDPQVSVSVFKPDPSNPSNSVDVTDEQVEILRHSYGHLADAPDPKKEKGVWPTTASEAVPFYRGSGRDLYRMATGHEKAPEKMPVWYETNDDGAVTYISHVKGGREAVVDPLDKRVADGQDHARLEKMGVDLLSPADAVFGTAQPGISIEGSKTRSELKSRVRFLSARLADPDAASISRYRLDVLEQPKPAASGFYLQSTGNATTVSWKDRSVRVAGTKFYFHTPNTYLPQEDKRYNASTVEAIEPGATFLTHVHFEDLDRSELGALLMALSLKFTSGARVEQARGWKLGLAKPLGYGSVANEVTRVVLIDRVAESRNPFLPSEKAIEESDWREFADTVVREYAPSRGLLADCDAMARHDTVWDQAVGYTPMGAIHRDAEGRQSPLPHPGAMAPQSEVG